jgi:hypothetical protein
VPQPGSSSPETGRVVEAGYPATIRANARGSSEAAKPSFEEDAMPTYMDVHDLPGVKAADVVGAHEADVRVQGKYGVNYKHYWVDEEAGKVFCLVDAPDRETATKVHREAHGLEAHTLYEVEQGA